MKTSLPYEYQLSSYAMLNSCIIKQENFVMFLYVAVFVLTALVCVSDSLFQSLLLELIGELLTTILIPYNILQGKYILSHNIVFFNRNIFHRQFAGFAEDHAIIRVPDELVPAAFQFFIQLV